MTKANVTSNQNAKCIFLSDIPIDRIEINDVTRDAIMYEISNLNERNVSLNFIVIYGLLFYDHTLKQGHNISSTSAGREVMR